MLDYLHMPTLFLATAILQAMAAIMTTGIVRMYGRDPAVRWWAASFGFHAAAAGIYAISGGEITLLVILLGNAFSLAGAYCVYLGVSMFLGEPRRHFFVGAIFFLSICTIIVFATLFDNLAIRNFAYTAAACLAYGAAAQLLLSRPAPKLFIQRRSVVRQALGASYMFLCVMMLWRALDLLWGDQEAGVMTQSSAHVWWMVSVQVTTFISVTGFLLLISEQILAELNRLAQFDPLTGAVTRSEFFRQSSMMLQQRPDDQWALAVIDLDHFKQINDSLGHEIGDAALTHVADILRQASPNPNIICRAGGDEFWLMFQAKREACKTTMGKIQSALASEPFTTAKHHVLLTLSIGVSIFRGQEFNKQPDNVLHSADEALYVAKTSGRNTFHIRNYSADDPEKEISRMTPWATP